MMAVTLADPSHATASADLIATAVVPVTEFPVPSDAKVSGAAEVKQKLNELRACLMRHAADVPAAEAVKQAWQVEEVPASRSDEGRPELAVLVDEVLSAFHASSFGQRTDDQNGERRAFELLLKPSRHRVAFRRDDGVRAVEFCDEYSLAERLGVMKYTNLMCLFFYVWFFTIGNLKTVTVLPVGLLVIAGILPTSQGIDDNTGVTEQIFMWLWILWYVPNTLWQVLYVLSYMHVSAVFAKVRMQFTEIAWLMGSRLCYTVANFLFVASFAEHVSPALVAMNTTALIYNLVQLAAASVWDASMVFFRLRMTRATYDQFFIPKKGCKARLQLLFEIIITLLDVARHYAVLYAYERRRGHRGFDLVLQEEQAALAEMTLAGRTFNITLQEVMTTSFGVSLAFKLHLILGNASGIGTKVGGNKDMLILNTE